MDIEQLTTEHESEVANKDTLIVRFKIERNSRFLSHHETVRVFQRALIRAGVEVCYSGGFNPHPKLSLPFPRSVGVESDEELACALIPGRTSGGVESEQSAVSFADKIKEQLSKELSCGIEIISVDIIKGRVSFFPVGVTYVFAVDKGLLNEELKGKAESLITSERLEVYREKGKRGVWIVDVAPYIEAVDFGREGPSGGSGEPFGLETVAVKCQVSTAGTVRVGEIMKLLGLDESMLAGAIRRTEVLWRRKAD